MIDLLSSTSRVETPFIIATIGDITFGSYSKEQIGKKVITKYPNFMDSLSIVKINGALNTYTLTMRYTITAGDDPNLLEKVFGKISNNRKIKLSYGDLSIPTYIYKEEEAMISDIRSNVDLSSSTITYTLSCISTALNMAAGNYNFPKRKAKPSDIIKELLYDSRYGLLDIFYGMINKEKVLSKGLILGDDRVVDIEAKKNISILSYLEYLVSCMSNISDNSDQLIRSNRYTFTIYDDIKNDWGGPYFKINRVSTKIIDDTIDTYEINIGYPDNNNVMSFSIDNDQTYSILYDYSGKINQSQYIYRINDNGDISYDYSPALSNSDTLMKTTEADKAWWTRITQFPISATLTIKGLLRPAVLMSYVKLNVLFYGSKHVSSGYYIVTKQTDDINASGYRTTLKLSRIEGA